MIVPRSHPLFYAIALIGCCLFAADANAGLLHGQSDTIEITFQDDLGKSQGQSDSETPEWRDLEIPASMASVLASGHNVSISACFTSSLRSRYRQFSTRLPFERGRVRSHRVPEDLLRVPITVG